MIERPWGFKASTESILRSGDSPVGRLTPRAASENFGSVPQTVDSSSDIVTGPFGLGVPHDAMVVTLTMVSPTTMGRLT